MLHCYIYIYITKWWISEWKKGALSRQATFTIDEVRVRRQIPKTFAWSFAFFYSLLEKEDWEGSVYLNDTRFFRFLRFFYSSMSKDQYLYILFQNKFKHNKFAKLKKFHRWFRYASDSISRRIELLLICQHAFSIDFTFSLAIDTREIVLIGY